MEKQKTNYETGQKIDERKYTLGKYLKRLTDEEINDSLHSGLFRF